ncbi:hypothetical protein F7725_007294 [Dissostichus mawsoni]|uniref:Uncharacterized protein n=1 Tax=Dissostichus mawsoni TaxID=36200 RepID=A0A7J5XWF9_DISMA|nr:hypothetical protein F7725_007294 [Dissostichus mawsoni]
MRAMIPRHRGDSKHTAVLLMLLEAAVRHTSIRAEHHCSSSMMNRGEDRLVSELSAEQRDRAAVFQLVKETLYHLQEASPTLNTGRKTD